MDINSLNTQAPLTPNSGVAITLNLKVGQQLDVKVIGADILAAKNAITLTLGNKDITVQSNQPITLNPGQDLKIQVTQIAPAIEFKILDSLPGLKTPADELRLKLITTAKNDGSVNIGREPRPPAGEKQAFDAKIISIAGNKIQLQILTNTPASSTMGNKQAALITIERNQLTHAPSDLKVGQSLNLEIVKTGTAPEFRLLPGAHILPEAKIAEFVKQFLPRHEAAPIFLNQLIKDLPQLLKNESVPQTLKDIAAKIVQNLPQKEQLISSQSLKQAIINSGLFLEAKLPMAQAELIIALPRLIKNESVPQSLQRIAAEILQSLTQNKPMFKDPGLEHAPPNSKPLAETPLASLKLNMPENAVEGAGASKAGALGAEDFKANLLKFIQALKQELSHQNEQHTIQADLDLLKNLQNKTENSVAKIVLDQLMSLPKEDNPKQLWIIDIPFMDRQQAETVKIEIQRDKENKRQSGNNDWSVNITITPPELGTIHCMVSYRNDVINTYFKSQNHRTTELIKHNLDYLKNQLEESGLKTGQMDAHAGTQKAQAPHQLAGKKLFDDNA